MYHFRRHFCLYTRARAQHAPAPQGRRTSSDIGTAEQTELAEADSRARPCHGRRHSQRLDACVSRRHQRAATSTSRLQRPRVCVVRYPARVRGVQTTQIPGKGRPDVCCRERGRLAVAAATGPVMIANVATEPQNLYLIERTRFCTCIPRLAPDIIPDTYSRVTLLCGADDA